MREEVINGLSRKSVWMKFDSKDMKIVSPLIFIGFAMFTGTLLYEVFKQLLFSDIEIREYYFITIGFNTVLAVIVAYYIVEKREALLQKIVDQNMDIKCKEESLTERVKELNCFYDMLIFSKTPGVSLKEKLEHTVSIMPDAWLYPDITCARIILGEETFQTEGFKESRWKQTESILANDIRIGTVEVFYLGQEPENIDSPFLEGEARLLNGISNLLGKIIESHQTIDELKQSEAKLKRMNGAKDKFFSIIAHDLRNPFQGLIAGSNLLLKYQDVFEREKITELIEGIYLTSNQSYELLENLLDWSKNQAGEVQCRPSQFNLNAIVSKNVNLIMESARLKGVDIVNEVDSGVFVYADKHMIQTVSRNILTNAVKFTGHGGIIRISSNNCDDEIKITVSDTGVGIREEDKAKLFRIGETCIRIGTAKEKGSGLGLNLCKDFVELNGGRIWVESEPGKGSNFYFTLMKALEN